MKKYNPTSPARRQAEMISTDMLSRHEPEKSLTRGLHRPVGRNNRGRITTRHKGGGVKRLFRAIDFMYDKKDMPAIVESLEYDPNRTSFIALVRYADGERRYVLAPQGWKVGSRFVVSAHAPIEVGNRLPLGVSPVGTFVYNIELQSGRGAQLVRSAGVGAEVLSTEGNYVQMRMPSGEIRMVLALNWATVGSLSNSEWSLMTIGSAGRNRRRGIRPTVRGAAMNPRDHPYGGGEGHQPRGTKRPKTAWGKITGGTRTRKPKPSDQFILRRRT
jgi:large subunit ribosomal protein L2